MTTFTQDPKAAARTLGRLAKPYAHGAFATPTAKDIEQAMHRGGFYEWPGVIAVARRLSADSTRRDWTGRAYTLPAWSRVITHLGAEPGATLPDLDGFSRVYAYAEDQTATEGLKAQGREVYAVQISASSTITNCWGRAGSAHRYKPWDLATLTMLNIELPPDIVADAADEAAALRGWADRYPFYCTTPDTEILTRQGWRTYDQVKPGDVVLTLNHQTGASEWQAMTAVNVFRARKHKMLSMEGRVHSSLTTLNHRWPVITRRYPKSGPAALERRFTTSGGLTRRDTIPTAAPCADLPAEPKYTDALVELVAWYWTEGFARPGGGAEIAQSSAVNPANVDRIRAALTAVFGAGRDLQYGPRSVPGWSERTYDNGSMTVFWLNKAASALLAGIAPDKVVSTEFILSLTRAQLELFLSTSVDADGTPTAKGIPLIYQHDRQRLEPVILACILSGRTPALYYNETSGQWSVTLMKRTTVAPCMKPGVTGGRVHRKEVVDYEGVVWCPTTPNGTWLARRNGKVYFTGNSDGSWGSLDLRGFKPDDPTWGIKPSEMSRAWWREHPEAHRYSRCEWTKLAADCPAMMAITGYLANWGELERVRVLRMAGKQTPGHLDRHTDITDRAAGTADGKITRFHIPLITHPKALMTAWNLRGEKTTVHLKRGSVFYLDARKPHAVVNASGQDRVHLVVDVKATQRCRDEIIRGTELAA